MGSDFVDVMGNAWSLATDGTITVLAAGGTGDRVAVAGPEGGVATSLAADFEGFVWAVTPAGALFRLNPRGPGYTDDGLARREAPGCAPVACVGPWGGDASAHERWTPAVAAVAAVAVRAPVAGERAVVEFADGTRGAVAIDADGATAVDAPRGAARSAWRALARGRLPCGTHDVAAATCGGRAYIAGGALWWRGYPAASHVFAELWSCDAGALVRGEGGWAVAARLPAPIAFCGLAALGTTLYVVGGTTAASGIPNVRSDEGGCWRYDVASRGWSDGPRLTSARRECAALALRGRVYAFGWVEAVESLGRGEGAWRREPPCPVALGGGGGRAGQFGAASLGDVAYFAGAFGLYAYDAAGGAWAHYPPPPEGLGACPLVAARAGRIYVLAGFYPDPAPGAMCDLRRDAFVFDPASATWAPGPELPCAVAWGAAFSVGGSLVTAGGARWCRNARTFCFDDRCFCLDGDE